MKKSIPVTLFAMLFALAGDTFAQEAKKFWLIDPSPIDFKADKDLDKYEVHESPDSTGELWWPLYTEYVSDKLTLVRVNSFDEKMPATFEFRVHDRLPSKEPSSNDAPPETPPDIKPKCAECHGGGVKLPPPKDSPAPPKKPPNKHDAGGGPEDDANGGTEDDSRGGKEDDGGGGPEDDANGGSEKPADTSKKTDKGDKSAKELKRLLSALSKGENPWRVGEKISGIDPLVWDKKYYGEFLTLNPFYSAPLGGDPNKKRDLPWIVFKLYHKKDANGQEIGKPLVSVLRLKDAKKK